METDAVFDTTADIASIVVLPPMEALRVAVSKMDASLRSLNSLEDPVRLDAVLDAAELLAAAKRVVLDA